MTPLEVVVVAAAVFVFGYLVWTLLRPEDF
jgi:K+-transporting ATPase KdpF subunit